jgi:hypothetical protein
MADINQRMGAAFNSDHDRRAKSRPLNFATTGYPRDFQALP